MTEINYDNFYHAVKPCLLSCDIWFSYSNKEQTQGIVHAGFQTVGEFKVSIARQERGRNGY